jgi:hypothetical protein
VVKKQLPTMTAEDEGLGYETIMDPGLAMRWGVPYVHLVVFAIDVDRLRLETEDDEEAQNVWPFGWEVFLTEMHLLGLIDPDDADHLALLEDVCVGVLEGGPTDDPPLGSQVVFAVYDAIERGALPSSLKSVFTSWKEPPRALLEEIAPLFERPEVEAADLAVACLEAAITPPLAPPTIDALETMVETYERDEPDEEAPGAEEPKEPEPD